MVKIKYHNQPRMETPFIKVGILENAAISFALAGNFRLENTDRIFTGNGIVSKTSTGLAVDYAGTQFFVEDQMILVPEDPVNNHFTLHNVIIGINFHWERKEDQTFKGNLEILNEGEFLCAINALSIEDYLISVISSEMSATSSIELLKAHAVISRSWLLAQVQKNKQLQTLHQKYQTTYHTDDELIKWYDREDHIHFDVCADDHCQRYQGITRSTTSVVEKAVTETAGEILSYEGEICDARFSKCCGGVTEIFENAWEPVNHPYLQKLIDNDTDPAGFSSDLENLGAAREWILGDPAAFCNSSDKNVLQQVLNDYDQETNDFFRWKVVYDQQTLSALVKTRSGTDFGTISDLIPLNRGTSGRITRLRIVGSKKTMVIGKELEIRKTLSKTHLYSSAFIVDKEDVDGKISFILTGAGWGHGVGLCQIGAAVMGSKGYPYEDILKHYFPGSKLEKTY